MPRISVDLNKEEYSLLLRAKDILGLRTNVSVVRLFIRKFHKDERKERRNKEHG